MDRLMRRFFSSTSRTVTFTTSPTDTISEGWRMNLLHTWEICTRPSMHISEISNERVEKVSDVLSVGQEVEVKLTDVDFEKKRISLSMKALLSGSEADGEDAE